MVRRNADPASGSEAEAPSDGEESVHEEREPKAKGKRRLAAIEANMGQFSEALYAHGEKAAAMRDEMDRMRKAFNEAVEECKEATDVLHAAVQQDTVDRVKKLEEVVEQLQLRIKDQDDTIAVLKRALANSGGNGGTTMKIRMKEPQPFDGTRDSKLLGNFCWDVEQYLDQMNGCSDEAKVNAAAMFLTDTAKLWWRNRAEDVASGKITEKIETWEQMKAALKAQFGPGNQSWVARNELMQIRHTTKIQAYIKAYTSVMLEIKDMSEEDRLYHFMKGLQGWAQADLRRQGVKTLAEAISAAEKLHDFRTDRRDEARGNEDGSKKQQHGKFKREQPGKPKFQGKREDDKPKQFDGKKEKKSVSCYICAKDHYARDCPLRPQKVAAVEQAGPSVGVMQVLSAVLEAPVSTEPDYGELSYVPIELNGHQILALVDSGATHNFVNEEVAKRLGLQAEQKENMFKAVNSSVERVQGVAQKISLRIGEWAGVSDFTIVPLDDFEVVIGQDFMKKEKAVLLPHLNSFAFLAREKPIHVRTTKKAGGGRKVTAVTATPQTTAAAGGEQLDVAKGKEGTSKEEVVSVEERFASRESVVQVEQRLDVMERVVEKAMTGLEKLVKFCKVAEGKLCGEGTVSASAFGCNAVTANVWQDDPEAQRLFDEGGGVVGGNIPLLLYLSQKEEARERAEEDGEVRHHLLSST